MMHRFAVDSLMGWASRKAVKPLVIRGARQVGKSYLVRLLAERSFEQLVEVNFEREPALAELFVPSSPEQLLQRLELHFDCDIVPGRTLLFLDEIQAAPRALSMLRYFREELPELHVIGAGSLLEVVLAQQPVPVPVGRIEYHHLGPMQFEEFLLALGKDRQVAFLRGFTIGDEIPQAIHQRLRGLMREFMAVGGMPEAVAAYAASGSLRECDRIKQAILSTYQDDFSKYGKRVDHTRLVKVYRSLPRLVGRRFKYTHIDRRERSKDLAVALDLLCLAGVAHKVTHSSGNGVPLAAESDDRKIKLLFLDVGLMTRALGMSLLDLERAGDRLLVNQGAVCEQLIGQHLLHSREFHEQPELYFWAREKRNSSAEVDYLISDGPEVIPVEVKAGKTGWLKSLHLFMHEKKRTLAVRLNSELPSLVEATTAIPGRDKHAFRLLSLPFYLVGQLRRLARAAGTCKVCG